MPNRHATSWSDRLAGARVLTLVLSALSALAVGSCGDPSSGGAGDRASEDPARDGAVRTSPASPTGEGPPSPVVFSEESKARLAALLPIGDTYGTGIRIPPDESRPRKLTDALNRVVNGDAGRLLVRAQVKGKGRESAVAALANALGHDPSQAEIDAALANACYDLALVDMVARRRYRQTSVGYILFEPDDSAVLVLRAAEAALDAGGEAAISPDYRARVRVLRAWVAGLPNEIAVTMDQARVALWLMASEDPDQVKQAGRVLGAYRWWMVLQVPPVIPSAVVRNARSRHLAALKTLGRREHTIPLTAAYDLGCNAAAWIGLWIAYDSVHGQPALERQIEERLRPLGSQVLELTSLLEIRLSQAERAHFSLETRSRDPFRTVGRTLEASLGTVQGVSYSRVYLLALSQCRLGTFLESAIATADTWTALSSLDVGVLYQIGEALSLDSGVRKSVREISTGSPRPDRVAEIVAVIDTLLDATLREFEAGGR